MHLYFLGFEPHLTIAALELISEGLVLVLVPC